MAIAFGTELADAGLTASIREFGRICDLEVEEHL